MNVPVTLRSAMMDASRRALYAASQPERLRWQGVWWRLHARESRNPIEPLTYSRNRFRLAADMEKRPEHYAAKPKNVTDWLHSGLCPEAHQ